MSSQNPTARLAARTGTGTVVAWGREGGRGPGPGREHDTVPAHPVRWMAGTWALCRYLSRCSRVPHSHVWSTTDGTYDGSPKTILELEHSHVLVRSQRHDVMARRVTHVLVALLA